MVFLRPLLLGDWGNTVSLITLVLQEQKVCLATKWMSLSLYRTWLVRYDLKNSIKMSRLGIRLTANSEKIRHFFVTFRSHKLFSKKSWRTRAIGGITNIRRPSKDNERRISLLLSYSNRWINCKKRAMSLLSLGRKPYSCNYSTNSIPPWASSIHFSL